MNPEIGWSELLVIGLVAIIVVGPKDLPILMLKLGRFMARMRNAAAEFQATLAEIGRQAELEELQKEAMKAQRAIAETSFSVTSAIEDPMKAIDQSEKLGLLGDRPSASDAAAAPAGEAGTPNAETADEVQPDLFTAPGTPAGDAPAAEPALLPESPTKSPH